MARGDGFSKPSPTNDSAEKQGVFAMRANEVWAHSRKASTKPWRRVDARCASFRLPKRQLKIARALPLSCLDCPISACSSSRRAKPNDTRSDLKTAETLEIMQRGGPC